jgi:hypothetical protein
MSAGHAAPVPERVNLWFELSASWKTTAAVPLYRCSECGFATTASSANALRAHEAGATQCPGELELVVDFRDVPLAAPRPRRRRRSRALAATGAHADAAGVPQPVVEVPGAPDAVADAPIVLQPVAEVPGAPDAVADAPIVLHPVAEVPPAPQPTVEVPVAPQPTVELPAAPPSPGV